MAVVGVKPHQLGATLPELRQAWREAEDAGFESVWVFDHVNRVQGQRCAEALSLLAALACETSRARIGVLVLNPGLRHPAYVASAAATIDALSGGRVEVGVGAGSQFGMADLAAWGLTRPSLRDRIKLLEEYCRILRLLWAGEQVTFEGQLFRLAGARIGLPPMQRQVPLILGGGSKSVMRLAIRYADEWNFSTVDPGEFERRAAILESLACEAGREVRKSAQVFLSAIGDRDLRDLVERFAEAGAHRVVLIPDPPYEKASMALLAKRVLG